MGRRTSITSTIVITAIAIGNYLLLRLGVIDMTLVGEAIVGGSVFAILAIFWWTWGDRITQLLKVANKPTKPKQTALENHGQMDSKERDRVLDFELRESYYSMPDKPNQPQEFHGSSVKYTDAVDGKSGFYELHGPLEDVDKIEEARKKIHDNQKDERLKKERDNLIKPLHWALIEYPDSKNDNLHSEKGLLYLLSMPNEVDLEDEWQKSQDSNLVKPVLDVMRENYGFAQQYDLRMTILQYLALRDERKDYLAKDEGVKYYKRAKEILEKILALVEMRFTELTERDS